MTAIPDLDPELVAPLQKFEALTGGGLDLADLPAARAMSAALTAARAQRTPPVKGIRAEDHSAPGVAGGTDVPVRVYRPETALAPQPALLWIHGGGFVMGSVDGDDYFARKLSRDASTVVVSVDYRLAPEHPFPAPLDDCYSALLWTSQHAPDLQIDAGRLAVGGASAGGGLAAGLALQARDLNQVAIAFQLLIFPMLDDRNVAPASPSQPDTAIWSRSNNLHGWQAYLGDQFGSDTIPAYAAPARATDLAGLPPAFIPVGDQDLFLEENRRYADRLVEAGVAAKLAVYRGGYHGFSTFAPKAAISRRFDADIVAALRNAFGH